MAKVLVIRKSDKTVHQVPLGNKASLMAYSNRLPRDKQWKFEELEEAEAKKLPFIDESYVTAAEAQGKVKEMETTLAQKDAQLADLQAKLAALESAPPVITPAPDLNTDAAEAQGKVKADKKPKAE